MLDWRATWCDLEPPPWLALLPLGSIEQHGPHLPIGTDWQIAQHLAECIARELDAWLLPALPYSCAQEHQDFPGTFTLRPATLAALLDDMTASLARTGTPRLYIINYHGGNWALKSIVRDLNRRQDAVTVYYINPYEHISGLDMTEELHSGAFETSQWLHLDPSLVREGARDCVPDVPMSYLDQVGMRTISPQGLWGRPSQADAARGARDLDAMVMASVRIIRATITAVEAAMEREHHDS